MKLIARMSTVTATIKEAKAKLRKDIDAKLSQLSDEEVTKQSRLVQDKLYNLEQFKNAKRVGLYLSLPCEIETIGILKHCFEQGKKCFIPRYVLKSRRMDFVELYSMEDFRTLPVEEKYQIKQPDLNDTTREEVLSGGGLDVLLVPGVAFTSDGLRCGHGKGYFDTWLKKCFDTPNIQHPATIALALREQILDHVPVSEFDVRISQVLYP